VHGNRHLQNSWNKYGPDAFEFSTLLYCAPEDLIASEQRLIDTLNPDYNLMRVGDVGWVHSEETKAKQRERAKAQWKDPEYLKKVQPRLDKAAELRAIIDEAAAIVREFERDVYPPKQPKRIIEHDGHALTYDGWAEKLGISRKQVVKRVRIHRDNLDIALKPADDAARTYTARGETKTLKEWAESLGESYTTLYNRIHKRGVPVADALVSGRIRQYVGRDDAKQRVVRAMSKKIEFRGESLTYSEWAERLGISKGALVNRIDVNKWSLERALTTPFVEGNGTVPQLYPFRGELISVADAAVRFGVDQTTIRKRLRDGESLGDIAVGRKRRRFEYLGEAKTTDEWASALRVTPQHIIGTIKKHGAEEGLKRLHENALARCVTPTY
jgi:DNA-directed RNA polymerase specialized sigma24 family protein